TAMAELHLHRATCRSRKGTGALLTSALLAAASAAALAAGCADPEAKQQKPPSSTSAAAAPSEIAAPAPPPRPKAVVREGGALVRSPSESALYLADEDHQVVRRIPIPVDVQNLGSVVNVPGHPAQVLALADRVLVTVRDPGQLLILSAESAPKEVARVELPEDAWGLAISPDEKTAFVSSAWSHKVSAVDIESAKVKWSVDVPREPRGMVVKNDGSALYVTHLVGAPLTKISDIGGSSPTIARIGLPPDPARTRYNEALSASLGYAAALSPDGERLFVGRHALGGLGESAWFGTGSIDVLATATDKPVLPARGLPAIGTLAIEELKNGNIANDGAGAMPTEWATGFSQPRALVYRKSTNTILLASEGTDELLELDALSVAPGLQDLRTYRLGGKIEPAPAIQIPESGGAPTGIALSEDELTAWVYCRSTNDLLIVSLSSYEDGGGVIKASHAESPTPWVRLTEEAGAPEVAMGKRLFYNGTESVVSGGMGCAGCHPEGRDDGHVWHEVKGPYAKGMVFVAGTSMIGPDSGLEGDAALGHARQTPMIAGRVKAAGPYGWHAESADLVARIKAGFGLHRWWEHMTDGKSMRMRAEPLAAFLREGLLPPPRRERELTAEEERGRELFNSPATQCATCHVPKSEYTDRIAIPLRQKKPPKGYAEDPNPAFK
ncbi:MAG TPA: hypothetical protein VK459_05615, partial [Polyangiaceae bacterium]|nr:hypothetical protein [Polyangiaceae bacterium]